MAKKKINIWYLLGGLLILYLIFQASGRESQVVYNGESYVCSDSPSVYSQEFSLSNCPTYLTCSGTDVVYKNTNTFPVVYILYKSNPWGSLKDVQVLPQQEVTTTVASSDLLIVTVYNCANIAGADCTNPVGVESQWKCSGTGDIQQCNNGQWVTPTKNKCSDYESFSDQCSVTNQAADYVGSVCSIEGTKELCNTNSDCDDSNFCTADFCFVDVLGGPSYCIHPAANDNDACGTGGICSAGDCVVAGSKWCKDTDSSTYPTRNPDTKGTLTNSDGITETDICNNQNSLKEWICTGTSTTPYYTYNIVQCESGTCSNGACTEITQGNNPICGDNICETAKGETDLNCANDCLEFKLTEKIVPAIAVSDLKGITISEMNNYLCSDSKDCKEGSCKSLDYLREQGYIPETQIKTFVDKWSAAASVGLGGLGALSAGGVCTALVLGGATVTWGAAAIALPLCGTAAIIGGTVGGSLGYGATQLGEAILSKDTSTMGLCIVDNSEPFISNLPTIIADPTLNTIVWVFIGFLGITMLMNLMPRN